jgi:hypothetical protein
MGRTAKYWRKKFHYHISDLIANLFTYVDAHLFVCIITCCDTPEMSRPAKNMGAKKANVIYHIGYPIANLFSYVGAHLFVCIITCCYNTPEMGGADP